MIKSNKFLKNPFTWIAILMRLLSVVVVFINPFWGLILYMTFDAFDSFILEDKVGMNYREYELFDKKLDCLTYIPFVFISIRYELFYLFILFFIFRLIGFLFFTKTGKEKYLIYFPDFILITFFVYISLPFIGITLTNNIEKLNLLVIIMIIQIGREYLVHFIYPKIFKQGLLRTAFNAFGYNYKRKY